MHSVKTDSGKKPNVIIILSDDQGYGDVSCHGNPWVETPHIDRLYSQSVRLEDFHTDPMCAPTRSSLMTGHYSARTGVWSTLNGRYIMRQREKTMAQWFKEGGYRTGLFGKWHLGDNWPNRAQDRGFDWVVSFGGGVVGETPDWWNNDYFDDKYLVDGKWQDFEGYCTDIWFDRAMKFIEEKNDEEPFFIYLANNAPHGPFNVHTKYVDNKDDAVPEKRARFYGMIRNIDENLGRLESFLEDRHLKENTLLVYMGDNGTQSSCSLTPRGFVKEGFNGGMRGKKCDPYEGGHRNMCFIRWPDGGYQGGKPLDGLTMIMDLLPTFVDLCSLDKKKRTSKELPAGSFDGSSLVSGLEKSKNWNPGTDDTPLAAFEDRTMIVHNMQLDKPKKYKDFAVMTNQWRMVRTEQWNQREAELFRKEDTGQKNDLAHDYPDVVKTLTTAYDNWWENLQTVFSETSPIHIGNSAEPVTKLTCHSWHGNTEMSYNQNHTRAGIADMGYWTLYIEKAGIYRFNLSRWPKEADTPICGGLSDIERPFCEYRPAGLAYDIEKAVLVINGRRQKKEVGNTDKSISFEVTLDKGLTDMKGHFICSNNSTIGAYYCYAEFLNIEKEDPKEQNYGSTMWG